MLAPSLGDDWLGLSDEPLPVGAAHDWAVLARCGAVVLFTGTVRDHAEHRTDVTALEYEAYDTRSCLDWRRSPRKRGCGGRTSGGSHCCTGSARSQSPMSRSIVVVSSPHRAEAFHAARFCIDALKATVPIWKRETWSGGTDWGTCATASRRRARGRRRGGVGIDSVNNLAYLLIAVGVQRRAARVGSGGATGSPRGSTPASGSSSASSARSHPSSAGVAAARGVVLLARDLAIDLGTANTLVYAKDRGIVLNEPTVIALNSRTQDVLAMGREAWQMIGRTPGYIVAVRPLRQGAITDFDITQRMIRLLLQRAGISRFNRPRVLICVPSAITEVERRAVEEAARRAGAAGAYLIEQPMAAAIGAGLPIHEPLGNMVVDVGGGTTEVAVISLGGIVALQAIRVGSFDIDAQIQTFVRREYGIAIGERTAEEIKVAIGSAYPSGDELKAEVRGRDLMSGLPKTVILSPEEVREAIDEQVSAIVDLGGDVPGTGAARAGAGPHHPGHPPRRRWRHAPWPRPAHRGGDAAARPPRRRAARVRRARRRSLHGVVRLAEGHVHGRRPLGPAEIGRG